MFRKSEEVKEQQDSVMNRMFRFVRAMSSARGSQRDKSENFNHISLKQQKNLSNNEAQALNAKIRKQKKKKRRQVKKSRRQNR